MNKVYGLVVCGGESSRMGMDKSLLVYYDKPQRYYLYEMLEQICEKVFISCNKKQATTIPPEYKKIVDLDLYENIGPMAALLSAFTAEPDADFLVIGCDYPFIRKEDLQILIDANDHQKPAVCYFNAETSFKEPLLAVYTKDSYPHFINHFNNKEYSLRTILKDIEAKKVTADTPNILTSVDTPEAFEEALNIISKKRQTS